ncbi:MAG: hypothetical protein WCL42_06110 [Chlorobiaceae bacterium]|jgi:hypothetical protein
MGVKELFVAIFTLLFRNRTLWRDLQEVIPGKEFNVLREYAVPVIALVQLAKFPLIGVPQPAMFFAITNFLIDIAVLYLMAGGVGYLVARERSESFKAMMLNVVCYSMTPVWLFELFYFTGLWSWLFAVIALSYTLVVGKNGLTVMFDLELALSRPVLRNVAFFVVMVNIVAFLLISAAMRLFNF